LLVQLDEQDVDALFADVYKELSQRGGIRGFRPGKAPRGIIKRNYGAETIRTAAWAGFLQDKLPQILEEADLQVIEHPELPDLEELEFEEGAEVEFRTILTVRPRAELPEYKGIKVLKPTVQVADEEVEQALEELRDSYAEEVEADRDVVGDGDIVQAAVRVLIEGHDSEPEEREQTIEVGSGQYDPPIDEKLKGHLIGQTVTAEKVLPDDYEDENLRGKTVTVEATIKAIKVKQLPELDDEFARQVDADKYENLAALREGLVEQLTEQKERAARKALEEQVLSELLDSAQVDLPASLLEHLSAQEYARFVQDIEREGLGLQAALDVAETTEEETRGQVARRTEQNLKLELIWEALIEAEGLEASDEELEAELIRYAEEGDLDVALVRQAAEVQEQLQDTLRERVLRRKAMDIVLEAAEVEEVNADELGARLAAQRVAKEAAAEETMQAPETSEELEVQSSQEDTEGDQEEDEA